MTKYHISNNGQIAVCKAKNNCPLGGFHSEDKTQVENYIAAKMDKIETHELKKTIGEKYSGIEASMRGAWVEKETSLALRNGMSTDNLYKKMKDGIKLELYYMKNYLLN